MDRSVRRYNISFQDILKVDLNSSKNYLNPSATAIANTSTTLSNHARIQLHFTHRMYVLSLTVKLFVDHTCSELLTEDRCLDTFKKKKKSWSTFQYSWHSCHFSCPWLQPSHNLPTEVKDQTLNIMGSNPAMCSTT